MKRIVLALACAAAMFGGAVADAEAPGKSPRPDVRKSGERAVPQEAGAVGLSPRPDERPENFRRRATVRAAGFRPAPQPVGRVGRQGRVCGDRRIRGEVAPAIPAKLPGCGMSNGVRVTEIDGVSLSRASLMNCETAKALKAWIQNGAKPAVGRAGGGLAQLKIAAHYICRTRNHRRGAPISEHGKGKAIDISALVLKNGAVLSVLTGWNDRSQGPILRKAHRSACGPFGTVLGPKADRHHRDHFHFDTARHRNGPYCR